MPVNEVKGAAERAGISETTLNRAKRSLGVVSEKSGFDGGWAWRLPAPPEDGQGQLTTFADDAADHLRSNPYYKREWSDVRDNLAPEDGQSERLTIFVPDNTVLLGDDDYPAHSAVATAPVT
jgi:hypothetical protein